MVICMEKNKRQAIQIVNSVCASMSVEGFLVNAKTQKNCMDIVTGKKTAEEMIKSLLAEYKRK